MKLPHSSSQNTLIPCKITQSCLTFSKRQDPALFSDALGNVTPKLLKSSLKESNLEHCEIDGELMLLNAPILYPIEYCSVSPQVGEVGGVSVRCKLVKSKFMTLVGLSLLRSTNLFLCSWSGSRSKYRPCQ